MWMRRDAGGRSRNALPDRKVILRLYGEGTAVFFQREMEALAFERMSAKGHGPRLLAKFPAGRVEEFLHAEVGGGCVCSDERAMLHCDWAEIPVFHFSVSGMPACE